VVNGAEYIAGVPGLITLRAPSEMKRYSTLHFSNSHRLMKRCGPDLRTDKDFSIIPAAAAGGIVLHAASVGEFNAAAPLVKALLKAHPDLPMTVTTLTPTGSERVKREFGDRAFHVYIPLDLPGATDRFLGRLQPRLLIIMETEIWPNLYMAAHNRNIPVIIANARLSDASVRQYLRFPGLIRDALRPVSWVGAQSEQDAARMIQCGALPGSTEMTGNLKFDLQVSASLGEQGEALRSGWGRSRPVLVTGSTHEADEAVIIPAFIKLLENIPDTLLILVPRHPERFHRAAQTAKSGGLSVNLLSEGESCTQQTQCLVVDAMGQLMTYYACADVAFVGGTMGEQGGHNALEPAALGKPVLVGPNTINAKEIVEELIESGAALRIDNQQEFLQAVTRILNDGLLRDRMGQAGLALIEKNKGALELTLKRIERYIQ
jgi:3-deoxy-D-manno-octulosonic-acid transferase